MAYTPTREDMVRALSLFNPKYFDDNVTHLSPIQATEILNDSDLCKKLFKENVFAANNGWIPMTPCSESLSYISKAHHMFTCPDSGKSAGNPNISGLSFQTLLPACKGFGIRGNIYAHVYDTRMLLGHLVANIRHFIQIIPPGVRLGVCIHFPLSIDLGKFTDFFANAGLGKPNKLPFWKHINHSYLCEKNLKSSL